ncbi:PspC domain-containing protein [Liquorilactobacillus uvarum]|uniref:PspC domain-containing protein n=1 Tax=Liquorilactobacillus uvarum TaxID=303240 RepID=UPI00288AF98A|nr:PspC domain-containing protein [Liquorilactobacillus uvarum]
MNKNKKIRRSRDRLIAGVCAGLAEYFKINPWVIRGLFIILLIIPHIQFLAFCIYVVLIGIMPAPKDSFFSNFNTLFGKGKGEEDDMHKNNRSASGRRIIKDVHERDIH